MTRHQKSIVHQIRSDTFFSLLHTNTRGIIKGIVVDGDERVMHPASVFASKTLFFVQRTRKHRRWYLRIRVIHVLATNGIHLTRLLIARSIRIKRRCICELHSRRVSRVAVDRALLDADKDHDERRIRTLRKGEKNLFSIFLVFSNKTHRGK